MQRFALLFTVHIAISGAHAIDCKSVECAHREGADGLICADWLYGVNTAINEYRHRS